MDCDIFDEEFVYGKDVEKIKRKKELILDCLRNVVDPDLKKNIVDLNFVRNLQITEKENKQYEIEFDLNLTTPACPVKEELVNECKKNITMLDWVKSVHIHETFANFDENEKNGKSVKKENYNKIENVILIYSCKGGVGKSFFSVNFSFYLKKKGASVGILDADINGPSLPTLLPFDFEYAKFEKMKNNERDYKRESHKIEKIFYEHEETFETPTEKDSLKKNYTNDTGAIDHAHLTKKTDVHTVDEIEKAALIEPLMYNGVKLMSYSYIKNKNDLGFAPFRGAILNELIHEFMNNVNWGALNYLIIDMPPGTSDMHLNLMESDTHIDGAIIITTPNELAINDVQKGINMCNYFNIPIVGLVVNMSYFICDNCDKKHYIFNSVSPRKGEAREHMHYTNHTSIDGNETPPYDIASSSSNGSSTSNSNFSRGNRNNNAVERGDEVEGNKYKKKNKHNTLKKEAYENREDTGGMKLDESTSSLNELKEQVSKVVEIPFHPLFAKNVYYINGAKKFPFMLAYNDHFLVKHLESVFEIIVREISILKNNDKFVLPSLQVYKKHFLQLSFDTIKNQFVFSEDILISHMRNIRMKCKCEICKFKKKKSRSKNVWDPSLYVKEIKQLGVHSVKIIWSDNHISVYPYFYLKQIFLKTDQRTTKKTLCCDNTSEHFDW